MSQNKQKSKILRIMTKIVFKGDFQHQNLILPPSLEELIPEVHPVRVVSQIVDNLNISDLLEEYKGGGTSSFHPRMLLKVLIYAYLNNIYSSRKIEKQLHENINFMWLSGFAKPDFRTINYFRGKRLVGKFDYIFTQVVEHLHSEGFVSLKTQYIDGTKIESAANKYSFVWRGSVEKSDKRLREKVGTILKEIESVICVEEQEDFKDSFEPLSTEDFKNRVERISRKIAEDNDCSKDVKKHIRQIKEESIPKLEKYEEHLNTMGERNSYSKTDSDATFMRMKEDAMKNGQLKPAYNVQISTENQIITNYGIYQRPGDTATLIPYLKTFEQRYGVHSETIVADSGYGSEQNYEYMIDNNMTPFVKFNMFHVENKSKFKNNPFLSQNLYYDKEGNYLVCPMGQKIKFIGRKKNVSDMGYVSYLDVYQAQNCKGCNMRALCHKSEGNRRIELNPKLNSYKQIARDLLTSEKGLYHRSMRPIEPEAVFGQIKSNSMFKRFRLRSVPKINVEFGLVALAHNIKKIVKIKDKHQQTEKNLSLLSIFTLFVRVEIYPVKIAA